MSPFEGERNSVKLKFDYLKSFSPSAGASYFSQNFDENGYVFDGVKIDVIIYFFSSRRLGPL